MWPIYDAIRAGVLDGGYMQVDETPIACLEPGHPMRLMREHLPNLWTAEDMVNARHGDEITISGVVICRQRPGTAKGFVFIFVEDETGDANAMVPPGLSETTRLRITQESYLRITSPVQTREGLPSARVERVERLSIPLLNGLVSYDFR